MAEIDALAKQIEQKRREGQLSYKSLAEHAKCDYTTIQKFVTRKTAKIAADTFKRIADVLKLPKAAKERYIAASAALAAEETRRRRQNGDSVLDTEKITHDVERLLDAIIGFRPECLLHFVGSVVPHWLIHQAESRCIVPVFAISMIPRTGRIDALEREEFATVMTPCWKAYVPRMIARLDVSRIAIVVDCFVTGGLAVEVDLALREMGWSGTARAFGLYANADAMVSEDEEFFFVVDRSVPVRRDTRVPWGALMWRWDLPKA